MRYPLTPRTRAATRVKAACRSYDARVQSITLIGPGAIGGTLATWLSQNPSNAVSVAVRTPFDSLEVETRDGVDYIECGSRFGVVNKSGEQTRWTFQR